MGVGFGVLRLAPAQFWAMTPRELSAAMEALSGAPGARRAPGRDHLAGLMARYPDTRDDQGHG